MGNREEVKVSAGTSYKGEEEEELKEALAERVAAVLRCTWCATGAARA